ncbi:MAG: Rrf2 family transcriptional regulator [Sulfurovum sp.]|nr:Rrf2 family transcriptional regulator [Sulfurovum sp.]
MTLVSSKGVYALSAMYALYQHGNKTPMRVREISDSYNIPRNYLDQILAKLRNAGMIVSTRGPHGGYSISMDAKDILVKDILLASGESLRLSDYDNDNTALTLFFADKQEKIMELFLLNLAELEKYKEAYNESLHFSI